MKLYFELKRTPTGIKAMTPHRTTKVYRMDDFHNPARLAVYDLLGQSDARLKLTNRDKSVRGLHEFTFTKLFEQKSWNGQIVRFEVCYTTVSGVMVCCFEIFATPLT